MDNLDVVYQQEGWCYVMKIIILKFDQVWNHGSKNYSLDQNFVIQNWFWILSEMTKGLYVHCKLLTLNAFIVEALEVAW